MSSRPVSISHRAQRFVEANKRSFLEYQSASSDSDVITFRLKDGSVHELKSDEARALDRSGFLPRWAHLQGMMA